MKKTKYLITIILFLIAQISIFAQSKVAHIDTNKLLSEMPEVIAAQKQIERLEKTYSTEIDNMSKEIQNKYQSYTATEASLPDVTKQARVKELETMQQNIAQYQQTASQDLQKKQRELLLPLRDKAIEVIKKVATAQGFDYVLDSSVGLGVIMAKGKDLMTDVKSELGF